MLRWVGASDSEFQAAFSAPVEKVEISEFWTPVNILGDVDEDPQIQLCQLNFKVYNDAPHLFPMFKDLVKMSKCSGNNYKIEKLSVLKKEMKSNHNDYLKPSGFVFHESRVGSTLVANLLGCDPHFMVFSESDPPSKAMLHCPTCSLKERAEVFKDIVRLMGHTLGHYKVFFKFQSITNTANEVALSVSFILLK